MRFLWKSMPSAVKENQQEVQAAWKIGQKLWVRDYGGVYEAIRGFDWSQEAQGLVAAFSVMALKIGRTGRKKFMQNVHAENHDSQGKTPEICDDQTFAASISQSTFPDRDTQHHIRSKRQKQDMRSKIGRTRTRKFLQDDHVENDNGQEKIQEMSGDQVRSKKQKQKESNDLESSALCQSVQIDRVESSYPFGQAFYQKTKRGTVVTYEDSSDNIHTCSHCGACFWVDEAIKKSSANAPLIYTNCCKKGQVKLEQPKPTPDFLQKLLDPNNGQIIGDGEATLLNGLNQLIHRIWSRQQVGTRE